MIYAILPYVIIADAILGFAIVVTATVMREITRHKLRKLYRLREENTALLSKR